MIYKTRFRTLARIRGDLTIFTELYERTSLFPYPREDYGGSNETGNAIITGPSGVFPYPREDVGGSNKQPI